MSLPRSPSSSSSDDEDENLFSGTDEPDEDHLGSASIEGLEELEDLDISAHQTGVTISTDEDASPAITSTAEVLTLLNQTFEIGPDEELEEEPKQIHCFNKNTKKISVQTNPLPSNQTHKDYLNESFFGEDSDDLTTENKTKKSSTMQMR